MKKKNTTKKGAVKNNITKNGEEKKPVLVTGGAGFIGSHVVDELIAMGEKVVVLDDLSGGFRENVNKQAIFVKGSVTDEKLVQKLFKKYKFEHVFHLAAYAAEGLSHFIRKFNYENNLIGSMHLINASVNHGVKCFVFTSSIAVYGPGQTPMREDMVPTPEDPYGIAKYAVEQDLAAAHHMFGLNHIIFRPHNVYGERQNIGDKYRNVIGIFMNKIMKGEHLPIFGDGAQKRAFTHIEDLAPYIARSIYNPDAYNHVFNLGADEAYTVKELAEKVLKIMDSKKSKLEFHDARKEVKIAYSDHSKSKKMLNHATKVHLDEGLKRMAEWAKKNGVKKGKKFKNIEVNKNLPPFWLK